MLRAFLRGVIEHQDLGTAIGPRDLEWEGFVHVCLVSADLEVVGAAEASGSSQSG